jgi:hypothetical protein
VEGEVAMFLIGGCSGTTLPWSLIGRLEMADGVYE